MFSTVHPPRGYDVDLESAKVEELNIGDFQEVWSLVMYNKISREEKSSRFAIFGRIQWLKDELQAVTKCHCAAYLESRHL